MLNILKQQPMKPMHTLLKQFQKPLVQRLLILVITGLITLFLGAVILFPQQAARAATLVANQGQTCAEQPTADHCNQTDPIEQGCVADATTIQTAPILHNGQKVGQLEMRYSNRCHSYWGRTFSFSQGFAEVDMDSPFQYNITGPFNGAYLAVYTNMSFEQRPSLEGWVNFTATDHVEATLS
jgi:hypothetical protein